MKILNLLKQDSRDKISIYQRANQSFSFDYSVQGGVDDNGSKEPHFIDATQNIDTEIVYEMKEVDYYA